MAEEPLFIVDHKPDRVELTVRAVCGALLGALVGLSAWARYGTDLELWPAVAFICTIASVSAYLAARYGDRYWEELFGGGPGWWRR